MTEPVVKLASKPPCNRDDALAVLMQLRQQGHVAYFAGGCVRDQLLGLVPKDFDIATDAIPARVRQIFPNTQAVGAAFGVILVRQGQSVIEVATFRADGAYMDGRRPNSVRFTTAQEDAQRRDFTVNGLFFDPVDQQVIDYVGGQADLQARVIRAIGKADHRFAEDHLRLLRAVRFAARYNFTIEPVTAEAIRRHAPSLSRIAPERIADELRLMLTAPTRFNAWQLLWEMALVDVIFRFIPASDAAELNTTSSLIHHLPQQPVHFGLALAAAGLDYLRYAPAGGQWAWPADKLAHKLTQGLRQALKLSNEESDRLKEIFYWGGLLLVELPVPVARLKRFVVQPAAGDVRALLQAWQTVVPGQMGLDQLLTAIDQTDPATSAPTPLVTGVDLLAAGLPQGPVFKQILDQVYDAQLEDRVQTGEQAMDLARHLFATTPVPVKRPRA